jgi:hypothetical protein
MTIRLLPSLTWTLPLLAAVSGGAADSSWLTFAGTAGPGTGKHVVLLSGDEEYRSEEALPMLAKVLSQRHGFRCTVLFAVDPDGTINPERTDSLPGAEALDSADAIVMLLRFRRWPDPIMQRFAAACARGVPIIALRTSTHAFNFEPGTDKGYNTFGKRVLGEQWVDHWGRHKVEATRGVVEASAKDQPILRGVDAVFGTTDVYEAYPPADATILLRGQVLTGMQPTDPPATYVRKRHADGAEQPINEPMMPIAWTRQVANAAGTTNRIVCTTMGAATDLTNAGLRRLVVNGVYWGLGLDVPASADVALVDPYEPTMYGFSGHRRGMRPADHDLGRPLLAPAGK